MTPASRHPRCLIRTTWVFRDGSWSKAEDKVDIRALGNKTKSQAGLSGNHVTNDL